MKQQQNTGKSGATGGAGPAKTSALVYWGAPVVLGVVLGGGAVLAWRHLPKLFRSDAQRIVDQWQWGNYEQNEELAEQLQALGPGAREDVFEAFLGVAGEYPELKVWVAEQLSQEPFFDTTSLAEQARSGEGWNRRAAATALALVLASDADPELVLPGIMDWLEDLSVDEHSLPLSAAQSLGPLPPPAHEHLRSVLLALARKRAPVAEDPDDDWTADDRDLAIQALKPYLPDDEILALLKEIVLDEDDDFAPRIGAVRAVAEENLSVEDVAFWKQASQSENRVVRQAVAENLFRVSAIEFDEVLVPLHLDPHSIVRTASVDTQKARQRPTMLPVVDQLLEDHDEWCRYSAALAVAAFDKEPDPGPRRGMLVRMIAEDENRDAVMGAILALYRITKKAHGVAEKDVQINQEYVEDAALDAFMADPEGRKKAAAEWADDFGGSAVWTTEDRRGTLERMLEHPDPENRERAKLLLQDLE